jgi:Tfp pilus assembly protein PilF
VRVGQHAGKTTITVIGSERPTYTAFKLSSPRRLVVDLANSQVRGVPSVVKTKTSLVDGVAVSQFTTGGVPVSRVMVNFSQEAAYRVKVSGNNLVITLTGGPGPERPEQANDAAADKAEEWISLGVRAMVEKNWTGAIRAFEEAGRVYRVTPRIREKLAEARTNDLVSRARAEGDQEEALSLYEKALAISPRNQEARRGQAEIKSALRKKQEDENKFQAAWRRGRDLLREGEPAKALPALEDALARRPGREEVRRLRDQARQEAKRLNQATLSLKVYPLTAMIAIDNQARGRASELPSLPLPAGRHLIRVSSPGYRDHREEITVRGGETRELSISLKKKTRLRPVIVY